MQKSHNCSSTANLLNFSQSQRRSSADKPLPFSPGSVAEHDMVWCSCGQLCTLPSPLAPPDNSLLGQQEKQKRPQLHVNAVQQFPKHQYIIKTISSQIQNTRVPYKPLWRKAILSHSKPAQGNIRSQLASQYPSECTQL